MMLRMPRVPVIKRTLFLSLSLLLFISFGFIAISKVFAYNEMPEFLCETGLKFYRQGRYDDALQEFKKALMVAPGYAPAENFIRILEKELDQRRAFLGEQISEITPIKENEGRVRVVPVIPYGVETSKRITPEAMTELLDLLELQQELITQKKRKAEVSPPEQAIPLAESIVPAAVKRPKLPLITTSLEKVLSSQGTLEIEQGQEILLRASGLTRFLSTYPEVIQISQTTAGDLLLVAQETGYSDVIIWDINGRHLVQFLVMPPKPKGPPYSEIIKRGLEREQNFTLRYAVDWNSYELGRRINSLDRTAYNYTHTLSLNGPTPYGIIDGTIEAEKVHSGSTRSTDLIYATTGLSDGQFGNFSKINIRGMDFSPPFSNLSFGGSSLRGAMLNAPAFGSKLHYTTFWGREGGGRYGALSPNLSKIRHHFMSGANVNFTPTERQIYEASIVRGWGRDRPAYLNTYGYDFSLKYLFDKWNIGYELGYDSENAANLINLESDIPKGKLNLELRNINKKFQSMVGSGSRAGEIGALAAVSYQPTEKLQLSDSLNVFKDRLYPSSENPDRLNVDNNWDASYSIDDSSSLGINYNYQSQLGRSSEYRYRTGGATYSKSFDFFKRINTYIGARHQKAQYMNAHAQDYANKKALAGLGFNLIGNLNLSLNKELNWVEQTNTSAKSKPHSQEARLSWSGDIPKTPLSANWHMTYHDEENTESPVSFLSGQDYLDGYSEINYRPNRDTEFYFSQRFRNNWEEKSGARKDIELDFNIGSRYVWDTGLRWEAVGAIEGYVFKDINLDGLRQRDEAPVEGIKVYMGKDKFLTTDLFGYYRFNKVKARNATVTLDSASVPRGYVLTTPINQTARIINKKTVALSFGIAASTEISGVVFVDSNNNGKYELGEKTVSNIVLVLENGKSARSDSNGSYGFINPSAGPHIISLQLKSVPLEYLPRIPLKKEVVVYEGVAFNFDVPLKEESAE